MRRAILLVALLAGCATQKTYYADDGREPDVTQFRRDEGDCQWRAQAAGAAAEEPLVGLFLPQSIFDSCMRSHGWTTEKPDNLRPSIAPGSRLGDAATADDVTQILGAEPEQCSDSRPGFQICRWSITEGIGGGGQFLMTCEFPLDGSAKEKDACTSLIQ